MAIDFTNEFTGLQAVGQVQDRRFPNRTRNQLSSYESVTYRISIGAIDRRSFNTASYVDFVNSSGYKEPRWIVIGESGYTGEPQSGEQQGSTGTRGARAPSRSGLPEYFINNLSFTLNMPGSGITANGNSGVAGGSFEVFEPYSLGEFFETLMSSANLSGYNHFIQSPFIIRIDFLGYRYGRQSEPFGTKRYIPILLQSIDFKADEGGSHYTVNFMQAGDALALNDFSMDIGSQIGFNAGRSPDVALFHLSEQMNKREQEKIANGKNKSLADKYTIVILNENTDDNGNTIKWPTEPEWEKFLSDPTLLKNVPGLDSENLKFGNNTIPNSSNTLLDARFTYNSTKDQRLSLMAVINDVMCHTTIATQAHKNADKDGNVIYFTVTKTARYQSPDGPVDAITGKFPKEFVYVVKPFKVKLDTLKPPTKEIKSDNDNEVIRKVYSYLYTGQNEDIIEYNMNFNAAFFLAGAHTSWEDIKEQNPKLVNSEHIFVKPLSGDSPSFNNLVPGAYPLEGDKMAFPNVPGGIGATPTDLNIARWVNMNVTGLALNEEKEKGKQNLYQLELNLKIYGDTYYIPTGGLGNQVQEKYGMAWEGQQVRIYVRFRTINDYPYPGSNLPQDTQSGKDHQFSGVYRLLICKNHFNDGVFTQDLKLVKDLTVDSTIVNPVGSNQPGFNEQYSTELLLYTDQQSRSDTSDYNVKDFSKKEGDTK